MEEKKEELPEIEDKEDYDFDFSRYEDDEEDKHNLLTSLKELKRPTVTGLRSRYSNGQAELDKLSDIGALISKYSIEVEARTKDIKKLWRYYGLLVEFWENIRNVFGSVINTEIEDLKKKCITLLEETSDQRIELKVYQNLLHLRSSIYRLRQLANFGIETERSQRGLYARAKKSITQ